MYAKLNFIKQYWYLYIYCVFNDSLLSIRS